ncbi:hypothetical protein ARMSODRAFT_151167 [Armillaria solidipes]|uniref:Uncharacterized protein n=1 Tax=Armillaria solidipes TaxID=1076256 RepID=A0A2H3C176_9AGAR|nr:hypothetical protein ARMSODRAFT_151167 [Armillaria solidipes]
MSSTINGKEILLRDRFACLPLMLISFLGPIQLQDTEHCDIQPLVNVSSMCRITENMYLSPAPGGLLPCLLVKLLDPFNADFSISPTLLRIANTMETDCPVST